MKKFFGFVSVAVFVLSMVMGCASKSAEASTAPSSRSAASVPARTASVPTAPAVHGRVPDFVRRWLREAPEGALVGVGMARHGTDSLSKTAATTRARRGLAQQLNSLFLGMIQDFESGSEADRTAVVQYTDAVSRDLLQANLSGAKIFDFDYTDDGTCYVMVVYNKADVERIINDQMAAEKKLAPARMAAYDALSRMDAAFEKVNSEPLTIRDTD